ncbi:DNA-binding domain-containing protein [Artemisia annua]|uniref:DNA-binding domain-containing protein n=1 Tax=Artemisia annua TaxID=35608 RepID=A0A2U1NMK3_ARTAN|nr:DNA-binding domain-containing protein [Artemisia annua]
MASGKSKQMDFDHQMGGENSGLSPQQLQSYWNDTLSPRELVKDDTEKVESKEIVTENDEHETTEENSDPAWGEMAESWYNSGWGPGSANWDSLDSNDSLMFPSSFNLENIQEHEEHQEHEHGNYDFSLESQVNPFFWKDDA